jgi:hypothetical protein
MFLKNLNYLHNIFLGLVIGYNNIILLFIYFYFFDNIIILFHLYNFNLKYTNISII